MENRLLGATVRSPNGFKGMYFEKVQTFPGYYIYEQFNKVGASYGFVVFERKINTLFNCESFPSGNAFGSWAWKFDTVARCIEKIDQNLNLEIHDEQK